MKKIIKVNIQCVEYPQLRDSFINWFVEPSLERGNAWLKSKGYDYSLSGQALTVCERAKDPIIWLRSRRLDCVVHECVHAVFHLMENIGIKDFGDQGVQEIFAYYVEYAVARILETKLAR